MLQAKWKVGVLEVAVLKAEAGFVVVEEAEGGRQVLEAAGCPCYLKALTASKPRGIWWLVGSKAGVPEGKKNPPGEHHTKPSEYADVPDSEFAGEGYTFPVNSAERVHSALAYFSKHPWPSAAAKRSAARKILAAAHKFHIKVSPDDNVARAAHGS